MEHELFQALRALLSWCEDNHYGETWFDPDDQTDSPDGTWKSYSDLPEWEYAYEILQKKQKESCE